MTMTGFQVIRLKCLHCADGSERTVAECLSDDCPLYPYRFGMTPTAWANKQARDQMNRESKEAEAATRRDWQRSADERRWA